MNNDDVTELMRACPCATYYLSTAFSSIRSEINDPRQFTLNIQQREKEMNLLPSRAPDINISYNVLLYVYTSDQNTRNAVYAAHENKSSSTKFPSFAKSEKKSKPKISDSSRKSLSNIHGSLIYRPSKERERKGSHDCASPYAHKEKPISPKETRVSLVFYTGYNKSSGYRF